MYKLNLSIPIETTDVDLKKIVAKKLNTDIPNIKSIEPIKKSIDARKKDSIKFVMSVCIDVENEKHIYASDIEKMEKQVSNIDTIEKTQLPKDTNVVIVGSGPSGLFAALTLIARGVKPTIIERGYEIERRVKSIDKMRQNGELDLVSNIQFGEGGAGTFSDGKLNTGTKSEHIAAVLAEFVKFGAAKEIEYMNKPHIGTDVLQNVVVNMRKEIERKGGKFLFGTKVTDIIISGGAVEAVEIQGENSGIIKTKNVILAVGHSARDTFEMLDIKGILMEQKPFSIGVRIEHKQSVINYSQYGANASKFLPVADYKLATRNDDGRGVYTFCNCPGGEVVCGSSEAGHIVTNGMSNFARDLENANSALLVSVEPSDFGSEKPLAGVDFQRKFEKLAFEQSNSYRAPVQLLGDLQVGKISKAFGSVTPSYKPSTVFGDLRECLPSFVIDGILFGAKEFDKKLHGFNSPDSVLTGVETRSSSPVRIIRNESHCASVKGLFPCGEGAGYAGGITSSAVDGIKTALCFVPERA